jgi:hypothetical protein
MRESAVEASKAKHSEHEKQADRDLATESMSELTQPSRFEKKKNISVGP